MWDRTPYDAWLKDGKRGALQNAEERAREILRMHAPAPLAADVSAELRRLVEAAEAELVRPHAFSGASDCLVFVTLGVCIAHGLWSSVR